MSNEHDNNEHKDKVLNDLYQQANQEQPPAALDEIILKQAKQAQSGLNKSTANKSKNNWRPWLAAASVVLVLPLIWFLTQNQAIMPEFDSAQSIEAPKPSAKQPSTKPGTQQETNINEAFADDLNMESAAENELLEMDQDGQEDQGRITVTGSRARTEPAPAPMLDLEDKLEQQTQRSISGKPINQESLNANKKLLKDEFKAKKRTIKPSNMDPLMALEYEQFGRYLEQGEIEKADQLLTDMQENWPDFDFEDMIYRLAEAELGSQ